MKWLNSLEIIFLLMMYIKFCNNASVDRYKKFTGDQGLYVQKDDVEILTINNFKSAITGSNKAWFVEFYSSWCGFCQRFAPSWKEFATEVKGWNDLVVVAAMDCANEENIPLCREYEVMGYPTLRYFHEGFQEESKNYGSVMSTGKSATDHKQDLLKRIINDQNEGRGKQFPNLLPYISSDTNDLLQGTSDVNYAILIIEDMGSVIGPEIILDLHKTLNVVFRYALTNNTDLINNLKPGKYPAIYIVEKNKGVQNLMALTNDKYGIINSIKEALKQKNMYLSLDQAGTGSAGQFDILQEENELTEKVKQMGDVVFQMDLETALRYSLKYEVGGTKEISGEKLQALQKYLHVLAKYFPFGRNGRGFLNEISNYADNSQSISGLRITELLKIADNDNRRVFSTPHKWLGCRGSASQYRGYPCGLWKMFHYLTVNVADYNQGLRGDNPRLALEAMHGYIKHFFGCVDCSTHFQEMAARRKINNVSSFNDSIIWLWEAHNEVNKRLSGDDTEDPDFPKIQFPSQHNCPSCHKSDGTWNITEVLKYLKHMYSSINVRYLGADTKVIHMGLEGDFGSIQAGLQEEAVQIQERPIRESLETKVRGETSSRATTKDKGFFMFPVFIVLTVPYVKKLFDVEI